MSRTNGEGSELIDMENLFYTGDYSGALNEFYKIQKPSVERDILMYRSYIAQARYRIVLDEIKHNNETPLLAVRYLAEYLHVSHRKNEIVAFFDEKFQGEASEEHVIWTIVAAVVYINEELYETAIKLLVENNNLECLSLYMHCLLKMSRVDLAKQVLQTMQEKDDDATLTQLSQAWLNIQIGGEKLQDAYYIFQDMCDKFSPTLLLMNGQAVCAIGQQKYEDAERVLRECVTRTPDDYDTLVNLLNLSQQKLRKQDEAQFGRYLSQLREHKNNALATTYTKKLTEFNQLVLQYGPSNKKSVSEIEA